MTPAPVAPRQSLWASPVLAGSWPDPARRQAARRASAAARAVLAEDGVDARSVLAGPATLAAALAGPARLVAEVRFDPADPLKPAPTEADFDTVSRYVAVRRYERSFPDPARR